MSRYLRGRAVDRTSGASSRLVLAISRMTVHNGPGYRTLILLKGCPLRCVWCSTPEAQSFEQEIALYENRCIQCDKCLGTCENLAILRANGVIAIDRGVCDVCGICAEACPTGAIRVLGEETTVEALLATAVKDRVFWKHTGGGITLSGGEPLARPEFTLGFLRACKAEAIGVGIDTSGYAPSAVLEGAAALVDFFLWDLKHMDATKHQELTGVSNHLILENARKASEMGVPMYIRVPVIPGFNDSIENILEVSEFARGLRSLVRIDLLPLHHLGRARYDVLGREYPLDGVELIPEPTMARLKAAVESAGLQCTIGG